MDTPTIPNHHRDHPGFAGLTGLIAAASMLRKHGSDGPVAAELVDLTATDRVVDIGCGPGNATRDAARIAASVVGVDPAPMMLKVARLATRGARHVTYVEGAAEVLPLEAGSATVVWTLASVHHWRDLDAGLAEVRRVLQPGGRFLTIERATTAGATGLASHGWTADQAHAFAELCRAAGFDDVQLHDRQSGRGPVHAVLAR